MFQGMKQNYQKGKLLQSQKNAIDGVNRYLQSFQKIAGQLSQSFPNDPKINEFADYLGQWGNNLNNYANNTYISLVQDQQLHKRNNLLRSDPSKQ